jgi:hypothetical protein
MTLGEVAKGTVVLFVILLGSLGGVHMCYRGLPMLGTEVVALTAIGMVPWMARGWPRALVATGLVLAGVWFPIRFAVLVHDPDLVGNPKALAETEDAAVPAWHTWFSGVYLVEHCKSCGHK